MSIKPKLTTEKVINKSFIVWGVQKDNRIKIYYKWSLNKEQYNEIQKLDEFVMVDYDKKKREWYITYVNINKILSCTIDDISSAYSIAQF